MSSPEHKSYDTRIFYNSEKYRQENNAVKRRNSNSPAKAQLPVPQNSPPMTSHVRNTSDLEDENNTHKLAKKRRIMSSSSENNVPKLPLISISRASTAVKNALNNRKPTGNTEIAAQNDLLVSYHDIAIKRADFETLQPGKLINDAIIAFQFQYLQHEIFSTHTNMLFLGPAIVHHLKLSSPEDCTDTLKALDLDTKDYIFLPVNDSQSAEDTGRHWALLVFSRPDNKCYCFDSSHNPLLININYSCYDTMRIHLNMESVGFEATKCLNQRATNDCAIHVLCNAQKLAEHIISNKTCRQLPILLDQSEILLKRVEITKRILSLSARGTLMTSTSHPNRAPSPQPSTSTSARNNENATTSKYVQLAKTADLHMMVTSSDNQSSRQLQSAIHKVNRKADKKPIKGKRAAAKTTRFKRKTGVAPEDQSYQANFSTVKVKLNTILTKHTQRSKIADQISKMSIKATKIASLASLLLLAKVNRFLHNEQFFKTNPHRVISDCFFEILDPLNTTQGKTRNNVHLEYQLPAFIRLLEEFEIQRPNNNQMGNMFKYLHQLYATNFDNNIVVHAKHRIIQFFNTFDDVTKIVRKNTMEYLFNAASTNNADSRLIERLRSFNIDSMSYINYERGSLQAVLHNKCWFQLVPLYIHIQRAVEQYNANWATLSSDKESEPEEESKKRIQIRSIAIVPICRLKRQHVRIDSDGLYRILAATKLLPKKPYNLKRNVDFNEFIKIAPQIWEQFFDIHKIETIRTKNKRKIAFHYQIQTDGVSASIIYTAPPNIDVDNDQRLHRIRENYKNGQYKYEVGIDLGYNTYIGAIRRDPEINQEVIVKIKSKTFHRKTKNNVRKNKFKRLLGEYERRTAFDREQYEVPPSPRGVQYWNYIRHSLQFWTEGIYLYTQFTYAKMPFDKYTNTQKTIDTILHELTNKSPSILFIGGVEFARNSPIKGHVRCPGVRKIVKAVRKYSKSDVIFVDEFMTSQHCGKCVKPFPPNTKSARFKKCPNCIPLPQLTVPSTIVTNKHNRMLQKERLSNQTAPIHIRKTITWNKDVNTSTIPNPHPTIWQRDIPAARLIWYKGLSALTNRIVHPHLNRTINNNDNDYYPQIIW